MLFFGACVRCSPSMLVALTALSLLFGCANTNFAKTDTPATVEEQWVREGLATWGGTRIYAIGEHQWGYRHDNNGNSFKVDPGKTTLKVWYFGNKSFSGNLRYQTDLVTLRADLKPNGRYQVRVDPARNIQQGQMVSFSLVDLDTERVIVRSDPLSVAYGPSKMPLAPVVMPIYVPAR
jgi:hypothetical protein